MQNNAKYIFITAIKMLFGKIYDLSNKGEIIYPTDFVKNSIIFQLFLLDIFPLSTKDSKLRKKLCKIRVRILKYNYPF